MLKEKLSVKSNAHLQKHLYEKGFLITDKNIENLEDYPFYGNWNKTEFFGYCFYVYNSVGFYSVEHNGNIFFLIGHAYNPYDMEHEEIKILEKISSQYGSDGYFEAINELTGIFILGVVKPDGLEFLLDASGMQYGCYGKFENTLYVTSHMRLIGDLCDIKTDSYVERLVNYRWYNYMMGNYMPGDLTCYKEIKRIIPNTYVIFNRSDFNVERFYPCKSIDMCKTEEEYNAVINEAAQIMKNTMELIPLKWERPAISLTGGIDSNTTFAAANGQYDKYTTFSYISLYRESVDAEKAKEISNKFNIKHTEYPIPEKNEDVADYELLKEILEWNDGGIGKYRDSEARKKIVLIQQDVCDVEVKSWISETIRAYAYKYFGRTNFPTSLTPRNYTSL